MPVTWTYTVTNTGNVELTNVMISDNQVGAIAGPIVLAPGQAISFDALFGARGDVATNWSSLLGAEYRTGFREKAVSGQRNTGSICFR